MIPHSPNYMNNIKLDIRTKSEILENATGFGGYAYNKFINREYKYGITFSSPHNDETWNELTHQSKLLQTFIEHQFDVPTIRLSGLQFLALIESDEQASIIKLSC